MAKRARTFDGPAVTVALAKLAVPAPQSVAVVDAVVGRSVAARMADGSVVSMRKAVSCLVAPEPGDRVLTAEADGEVYVLAVLERAPGRHSATLRIETEAEIEFVAKRISLRAGILDVLTDAVTMMGDSFNTLFRRSKRVVGNETVVARSTSLHAGQRVAVVTQADVQHAGVLSQTVDGPLAITSQTAVVTAKSDIRLNGERINVG